MKVRDGYKNVKPVLYNSASFSSPTALRSYPLSFLMGSIGLAHVQVRHTGLGLILGSVLEYQLDVS